MQNGVQVVVVDASKGRQFFRQLNALLATETALSAGDRRVRSLVLYGLGSAGSDIERQFIEQADAIRESMAPWVKAGGHLLVQGEAAQRTGNWPSWFDLSWTDADYFRTDHECYAHPNQMRHWCTSYNRHPKAITGRYNVKACLLKDVAEEDTLFGAVEGALSYSLVPGFGGQTIESGRVAIAYGRNGEGTVSFFGDVNWEDETIQIMAVLAQGIPSE